MEGSKTFSKAFMDKHSIPTADFHSFNSDQVDQALQFIQKLGGAKKVVLKASGLAGGKGVLLPENEEEAKQGVEDILVKKVFGSAGESEEKVGLVWSGLFSLVNRNSLIRSKY